MRRLLVCCFLFLISIFSYAYAYSSYDDDDNSDNSNNQNQSSSDTSSKDSSATKTDSGNNELVKKMDQSTEKGLKVFDKILGKDGDQAKQDFAENIGQNPTSGELGGDGDDDSEVKNPFGEFSGSSNSIDQGG